MDLSLTDIVFTAKTSYSDIEIHLASDLYITGQAKPAQAGVVNVPFCFIAGGECEH